MHCRSITDPVLHGCLVIANGLCTLAYSMLFFEEVSSHCRWRWLPRQQESSRQSLLCRSRLPACRTRWQGLKLAPTLQRYKLRCIHMYTMLSLAAEVFVHSVHRCHWDGPAPCILYKVSPVAADCDYLSTHMQYMSHGKHILCCKRVRHVDTGGGCSKTAGGDGGNSAEAEH